MSPVPLHVSPASISGDMLSVQNLLDSLGADTILRSRDSCEIRVPELYVSKFSPVLGALIRDASNSTIPANADASLPAVQLPESGAILISLLSFVYPLSPTLPPASAIEATMELLSAAQKYKMSSVLAHIRLYLTQRDPPFIHDGNAFHAYSLAQKYGLRQEAVNAAQLTLNQLLTFWVLEEQLNIMPGAYLHELWMFHEKFRTCFETDLRDFKDSSASSMLKGLECTSRAPSGTPSWLNYFISFAAFPFVRDFFGFQKAWVQHIKGSTGCSYCGGISPEIIRTIWTTMDTVVRGSMEKAESALTILGGETHSRTHICSPTIPLSLPECIDKSQADVIVRSSDHVDFRVHKAILATSSPVFNDIFSLAQPSNHEAVDGFPIVQLSEDAELVRALITALYPIPFEMPASYNRILALLAAAQKYNMDTVQSSIRTEVSRRKLSFLDGTQVFRAYAIASSSRLIPEMDTAARLSLDLPMTFEYLGVELRLFEGWALRALVNFRILYKDNLISCFDTFLDTSSGPSTIWALENLRETADLLASRDKPGGTQSLPAWLHNLFRGEMGGSLRTFISPLVGPSEIRAKYMSALQKHVTMDKCKFCPGVHVLEGENYIAELERALTQIRNTTTLEFS
ncbi:hypothetical protein EDB84DRAFT_1580438 [Lactarius hengduanensis]|nr:hypothetical protein EDB84DRAFT_1580438 [Lactarius hengduanensis]